ncbi:hypothetical protein F5X98DRAFT_357677 [Xylaria grammica]|nr:hypothetical protein F5X98DRAFT_357677 [Xylaria grammica]
MYLCLCLCLCLYLCVAPGGTEAITWLSALPSVPPAVEGWDWECEIGISINVTVKPRRVVGGCCKKKSCDGCRW